jgi:putative spermidine/putrescine transport system permease protein
MANQASLKTPMSSSPTLLVEKEPRFTWGKLIRWITLIVIVLWVVLPFVPLFIWSFSTRWPFPNLLPEGYSLRAWEYLLNPSSGVGDAIVDSIIIAVIVTFVSVLISIPAGRAMGLYNFRGKQIVFFLILAPTIIPGLASVFGVHVLFLRYGLANTIIGVIIVHLISSVTYASMVMIGVFSNYDPDFEEQARVLGANSLRTFRYVTFPAIFPGLVVAGLFAFLLSWYQYILTLIIGGGQIQTLSMLLFTFARTVDKPVAGAVSIVFMAPAILVLIITSRFLTGENAAVGGLGGRV